MTAVQQSGNVTANHLAVWATNGVIMDGGVVLASEKVLTKAFSVNFNDTADVPLLLPTAITAFKLQQILITNASISMTAAVGGFYPQASKAGTAIVAASQVYSSLSTAAVLLQATLASFATANAFSASNLTAWSIYFALTTPQGAAATADIYICGIPLLP